MLIATNPFLFLQDKALPPVLYLQADNSAKDNKNFILIGFLANLVQRKVFHKVRNLNLRDEKFPPLACFSP